MNVAFPSLKLSKIIPFLESFCKVDITCLSDGTTWLDETTTLELEDGLIDDVLIGMLVVDDTFTDVLDDKGGVDEMEAF